MGFRGMWVSLETSQGRSNKPGAHWGCLSAVSAIARQRCATTGQVHHKKIATILRRIFKSGLLIGAGDTQRISMKPVSAQSAVDNQGGARRLRPGSGGCEGREDCGLAARRRSASFKLIWTTSAIDSPPKRQRGHLNLAKRGHYDFALSKMGFEKKGFDLTNTCSNIHFTQWIASLALGVQSTSTR